MSDTNTDSSIPATTTASQKFQDIIAVLANELELDVKDITDRVLKHKLVTRTSDKGAEALLNVSDDKFVAVFTERGEDEVKTATAAMRAALKPKPAAPAAGTPTDTDSGTPFQVLPKVRFTEQLISDALKTGGVSQVGDAHVEALMRVYCAELTGFYGIPDQTERMITQRMKELKIPAPPNLRRLRKQIRKQRQSTLLADLLKEDADASTVTRQEQDDLLENTYRILIPKLAEFAKLLLAWEQRATSMTDLSASVAVASALGHAGAARARLAARKTNNLNTTPIKNAIGEVNDAINETFAGLGIEAAIALFDEARFCSGLLTNNDLLALVGKTTREEVMASLGLQANDTTQQLETDLAQFVIAVMNYPKTAAAEFEITYLCEMLPLAENIPWDTLPKNRSRNGFGASPYSGNGTNNALGVGSNGHRGAGSRDGLR